MYRECFSLLRQIAAALMRVTFTYRLPPYRGGYSPVTEVIRKDFALISRAFAPADLQRAQDSCRHSVKWCRTSVDLLARSNFNGGVEAVLANESELSTGCSKSYEGFLRFS